MSAMRPCFDALKPLEAHVKALIEEQQRAEEEQASQQSLKAIQKAFHEAMLALPREEYDWFDVQGRARHEGGGANAAVGGLPAGTDWDELMTGRPRSRNRAIRRSGSSSITRVPCSVSWFRRPQVPCRSMRQRKFRALPRDRSRRRVVEDLQFAWELAEGAGPPAGLTDQEVEYRARGAGSLLG